MAKAYPGIKLKELIMDAFNLKIVFLSGTPMINNLFEGGQLFNLLCYIYSFNFIVKKNNPSAPNYDDLKKCY